MMMPGQTTPSRGGYSVVAVGGSAGVLEALSRLLGRIPRDFALPLIVVIHLPKHSRSQLVDVLAAKSKLSVREPDDKEAVSVVVVYLAPPDHHLLVDQGPAFALSLDPPQNFCRPSIDVLFASAAELFGDRTVGVLLSGANDDGARGLRAIGDRGGLTLVHSPEEATSREMPAAGLAHCPWAEAASAEAIGAALRDLSIEQGRRRA